MNLSPPLLDPATIERNGAAALAPPLSAGDRHRRWRKQESAAEGGGPVSGLSRARRMSRCGRAALLWLVAVYAVAQTILFVVLDRWHPDLVETTTRNKWKRLQQVAAGNPGRPLLVMLGSSRTEHGFQADRLNGMPVPGRQPLLAYNYGTPGSGPIRELLHLREMLDAGIRPHLLLVEFVPPMFNDPNSGLTCEEVWISPSWATLTQYLRLRPYLAKRKQWVREWLEGHLVSCYSHRVDIITQFKEWQYTGKTQSIHIAHDSWGWLIPLGVHHPLEVLIRHVAAHNMWAAALNNLRLGDGPVRAMHDLLALCRQEQIPVVLVQMPESTMLRSWYSAKSLADLQRLLDELRTTYGVPVIDAGRWISDDGFVDGNHPNAIGADRFTNQLRREVRRFLARGPGNDPARR
jgi:hypothetical protein